MGLYPPDLYPRWRGEPVTHDGRWVIGPFTLTEPDQRPPVAGEEMTLSGMQPGSARLTLKVLDVDTAQDGRSFKLLAEVVQ